MLRFFRAAFLGRAPRITDAAAAGCISSLAVDTSLQLLHVVVDARELTKTFTKLIMRSPMTSLLTNRPVSLLGTEVFCLIWINLVGHSADHLRKLAVAIVAALALLLVLCQPGWDVMGQKGFFDIDAAWRRSAPKAIETISLPSEDFRAENDRVTRRPLKRQKGN